MKKTVVLTIRIDKKLKSFYMAEANRRGSSLSSTVRELLKIAYGINKVK